MASTRAVWGIDIGQVALKALRIRQVGDKVEALAYEYIEHPKILSQPDADRPALVAKALEQFLSRHDVRQDRVVVGVPGQHTLSRFTKLPPVEPKKIPDIVRFEANQQIPFDMDEVIWDYQTFRSPETNELEVGIFAMRRELVGEHLQPFAASNIEPVIVQSAPLALYNALFYDGLLSEGATLLLDIGAQNTDLIVAEPHSLWTRNIPIGGNNFTDALVKTFKISFAKAESLKRTATSSKYARQIFQAMRPVFADLVAEIQRSMGFYSSTHRGVRIVRAIGMGNAFKLPGLQKFLQSNLNIEVVRPSTFNKLSIASVPNAPDLIEHLLSFGVAYGLALQGLGKTQITSNLLPPEIAKAIIWRRKTPWFWAAAACLALSAGLVWGRYFTDAGAIRGALGNFTAVSPMPLDQALATLRSPPSDAAAPLEYAGTIASMAEGLRNEFQNLESQFETERQKIEKIVEVQKDKTLWPRILQEIFRALPAPQKELADAMAAGPEEYKKAAATIPRGERKQIFIQSMSVTYASDVAAAYRLARGLETGASGMGMASAADGSAAGAQAPTGPGFVVRLQVLTPNAEGGAFLEKSLLPRLAAVKDPNRRFHFEIDLRRALVWRIRYSERASRGLGTGIPYGGAGMYGTPFGGMERTPYAGFGRMPMGEGPISPGTPAAPKVVEAKIDTDPVTGEPMGNDFLFEVMFQIVLDQKDAAANPADAGAAPA